MSGAMDKMVQAGLNATMTGTDGRTVREVLGPRTMRAAIEAAFAAAPTVVDFVWCEHEGNIHRSDENRCALGHYHSASFDACSRPCPGPHHTILIIPEVKL
jgi:hypothetical protein